MGTALALALSLQTAAPPPAPPLWWSGRLYTAPALHLGVRPALSLDNEAGLEVGVGVTVQLSTKFL